MNATQSLAIIKALADESRLSIVSSLLEQPQYVEEIARRHALAPSTVSFHLKKLEQAGLISSRKEQYYVVVAANEPLLATTLRELVIACATGKELQDQRLDEYRRKVIASFFPHGVLEKLPAQHKKRLIVLEQFALRFEAGKRYAEAEVTGLIRPLFNDYCSVRRLLVDEGLIKREDQHYWREESAVATAVVPLPATKVTTSMVTQDRRAELKRSYKENRPSMGIYQIKNRENGKLFLDSSTNLEGSLTSRRFQLQMGKISSSASLQKDLTSYGANAFEVSIVEELSQPEPGQRPERLLLAMKLRWQETLQPFGERGYNSLKQFEREQSHVA